MKIYPFTKEQKIQDSLLTKKSLEDTREIASKELLKLVDKHLSVGITLFTI